MSKVFDRAMFKAENQPLKAESGIMQGFDEEGEIPEDEMMEEVSQRKPNSPEILMNNLRGDMRSVDARYQELADMVGEDVASETPPEVLALLQSQLAQQSMGIGALPPGQGVPPPPMPAGAPPMPTPDMMGGMPQPGAMPQGPEGQMPQGFADGGMVGGVPGYAFGGAIRKIVDQVTAQPAAADIPAEDPAVVEQRRRDFIFKNPFASAAESQPATPPGIGGIMSRFKSLMPVAAARPEMNPEFAPEFARRFNRGPGPQVPTQQQVLVPTPQFAEGGMVGQRTLPDLGPSFSWGNMQAYQGTREQEQAASEYNQANGIQTMGGIREQAPAPLNAMASQVMGGGFARSEAPQATPQYNFVAPNTTNSSAGSVNGYGSGYGNQGNGFGGGMGGSSGAFPLQGQYGIVKMAKGGIASLGNFSEGVAQAGRNGDTVLAHMTPEQHQYLTELGGGATVNPQTGLPEHFMGMQALGNMGSAMATRAAPYLQQANVLAGRALYNPTFTAPTLNQTRTTLGTFGPKVAEGMEMTYPTFTQGIANSRVGQMVSQGADKLAQTPAWAKMGAAVMSIPGATYIADQFDNPNMVPGNKNAPVVPGDPATGWKPEEEVAPEATPVDYNNLPVAPAASDPASEAAKNNQLIQEVAKKRTRGERLDDYMAENVPIFEKYLGGDKDYNQAQALFVLADMGLKFASSRKPGESFASAFARSAQGVPAGLSTIAAAEDQAKRQVKSAALTSGLQALAAEDKAAADLQKEIIKKSVSAGEIIPTDLGGGLTAYRKKDGQPAGMRVDETVTNSFLNSKFTPQAIKDEKGVVTGFDTPYVRVSPPAQTVNLDKGTRERLAGEVSRHEQAMAAIDDAIKEYTNAFGPKAFFANLKNNVLVPVSPLSPDVHSEQQKTKINMAINIATKAIAKTGDTGNIAVAEQRAASDILGDKPGTFFSDPETALKRMMTVRTSLANQRLNTASQLGWLNQDVQLDVPNLGTVSDPIPQDKMTYLKSMAKTFPNGQVYVNIGGKTTPVLLSTLKD